MADVNHPSHIPILDRLSTKITIAAGLFLFVLAAAVAFQVENGFRRNQYGAYSSSQGVLEEQTRAAVVQSVTAQAQLLDTHLRETSQAVRLAAGFMEAEALAGRQPVASREIYQSFLARLLEHNPDLTAAWYAGPDGAEIRAVKGGQIPASGPPPALPGAGESSGAAWTITGPRETWPVSLVISAPVSTRGLLSASLPLAHLQEHLRQFQTLPGGSAAVVDGAGNLIAAAETIPVSLLHAGQEISATGPESRSFALDGEAYLLVSIPLSEPGWRVLFTAPAEAITDQSKSMANAVWAGAEGTIRSTLATVFVLFLAALLGSLAALDRFINRRIARLAQGVQAITAGDLSVSVPDQPVDELGLLGRSFNQMTGEIRRRSAELLQVNADLRKSEEEYRSLARSLEARVEESTREIKQLYQQASTRSQELEVLYQADEQLYRHLRVDDVLQALVDVVIDRLHADKSSVMVWDGIRRRLVIRAVRGFSPAAAARWSEHSSLQGAAGRVFKSGQIITLEDAASAPAPSNQIAAEEGIRSVIAVPITIKNHIYGVFEMNYCQARRFSLEDNRLFQALAQRAAIAIENASLYEQSEQAATLEERQRLARELHDAITQSLYSLVLLAEAGRRHAAAGSLEQVEHHLGRLGETAQQALKEMRLLVYELRPLALAEVGLGGAIRQRLEAVEKRAGVQARFFEEGPLDLPPAVEEQVYRLVQEALNNILKHANARSVSVQLRIKPTLLEVEVRDDGQGFDPGQAGSGGIGLNSMRERAERIGGTLDIESAAGLGTLIRLAVRLNDEGKKEEGTL